MTAASFAAANRRQQLHELRRRARTAAAAFGLRPQRLDFLNYGENATYRARCEGGDVLIRLHREGYNDPASIASELDWLDALRASGLPVQRPLRTTSGDRVLCLLEGEGPAHATALSWVHGALRIRPTPAHFHAVGALLAQLHSQSASWTPPAGFRRRDYDSTWMFFEVKEGLTRRPDPELVDGLAAIEPQTRGLVSHAYDAWHAAQELLNEPWRLIHADLHLGNVIFDKGRPVPIDFDDCGIGPRVLDLAVVLCSSMGSPRYSALREQLLAGYGEELSDEQLSAIDLLMLARETQGLLWIIDRTRSNARFRAMAPKWVPKVYKQVSELREAHRRGRLYGAHDRRRLVQPAGLRI